MCVWLCQSVFESLYILILFNQQVAPNITAFGVPPTYLPQLTQVYSPRPGAVYVPAAATYDASARFDGHAVPVVPVSTESCFY